MTLNELETALMTRLRELNLFATVEPFKGSIEDVLKTMVTRFPACLVVHQGARYERMARGIVRKTPQYSLLICCQSYRGEASARLGAQGANTLLEAVESALLGKDLGLALDSPFMPVEAELLNMVSKDGGLSLSVYDFRWETAYSVRETAEATVLLNALEARYRLEPDGEQGATDIIDLEGS